jgi:threonine dehydratase
VPDLAEVVVPVGGGGLASGVAMAVKAVRPDVRVVGVQAEACAPFVTGGGQAGMAFGPGRATGPIPSGAAAVDGRAHVATIADGIAIKRPGELTRPLVERWVDDLVAVSEELIADAMVLLAERAKLVVEGAGAASVAALLSGAARPAPAGTTVAIVSGGNVDAGLLATVAAWAETSSGRRLRIFTRISDRPGGLAALLRAVAEAGGNVLDVEHVRAGVSLHVGETGAELILETRGADHADEICARLRAQGYEVVRDAADSAGPAATSDTRP